MRIALAFAVLFLALPLSAAPPAPSDARPEDFAPPPAASRPQQWPQEVVPPVPASAHGKRNWLLARLTHPAPGKFVDADRARSIELMLANMSPEQLDALVHLYQEKRGQPSAADDAVLDQARQNLRELEAQRDLLALRVANAQATQQQLPPKLNLNVNFGAYGFGPYGMVPNYGGWPGVAGYGMGLGAVPAYGYGVPYGYVGYPAFGYGMPYPVYGGYYPGVVGPAY